MKVIVLALLFAGVARAVSDVLDVEPVSLFLVRVAAVAFGAPPSVEPRLADAAKACAIHVANGDDGVPRLSRASAAAALQALSRSDYRDRRDEDVQAITKRALDLWPPRHRTDSRVGALSALGP